MKIRTIRNFNNITDSLSRAGKGLMEDLERLELAITVQESIEAEALAEKAQLTLAKKAVKNLYKQLKSINP